MAALLGDRSQQDRIGPAELIEHFSGERLSGLFDGRCTVMSVR